MQFVLASKSPRRIALLKELGMKFDIIPSQTPENSTKKRPAARVKELAVHRGRYLGVLQRGNYRQTQGQSRRLAHFKKIKWQLAVRLYGGMYYPFERTENAVRA